MVHSVIVVVSTTSESLTLKLLGGLTNPLFLCKILITIYNFMEKDKLKLIVRNLELLIDALKSEVYSDRESFVSKQENFDDPVSNYIMDYDEVFEDD